ncbi:N-acetyltransferase [Cereibacter changlensis JA139]|uniref:N-acetyltransferase n=2 Tax=Cereibacter changlensis TaxID=402884 RepID=A0A2T4JWM4_9RHOB|nr:GNAT family N-acetyltransferase [Cereibacter changlensis]PTE22285.1 N-acetyltransferase [Cereibacter changlensis JA139]PZX57375.1 RimJ/RimL family protein N-acetyltransferase [Cereibacter changlensis]
MIRTARLLLRRAEARDLEDLHAVFSRREAMRYWSRPPYETLEETRAFLANMITAPAESADDFVIERDGRVIGKAGAWSIPEIGFILHPDHWGQGIGREALTAVIGHLFAAHDMRELVAEADPRNTACLRLLARLGFGETGRAERTMQWGDEWCDSVYLAVPRDVWEDAREKRLRDQSSR